MAREAAAAAAVLAARPGQQVLVPGHACGAGPRPAGCPRRSERVRTRVHTCILTGIGTYGPACMGSLRHRRAWDAVTVTLPLGQSSGCGSALDELRIRPRYTVLHAKSCAGPVRMRRAHSNDLLPHRLPAALRCILAGTAPALLRLLGAHSAAKRQGGSSSKSKSSSRGRPGVLQQQRQLWQQRSTAASASCRRQTQLRLLPLLLLLLLQPAARWMRHNQQEVPYLKCLQHPQAMSHGLRWRHANGMRKAAMRICCLPHSAWPHALAWSMEHAACMTGPARVQPGSEQDCRARQGS